MRDRLGVLCVMVMGFFLLSSSASGLLVTDGQWGQGGQGGQGGQRGQGGQWGEGGKRGQGGQGGHEEARDSHTFSKESDSSNKAILEMLHIDKVSASHRQLQPHPYMRQVYLLLDSLDAHEDLQGNSDATLVQSFRRVFAPEQAPPGWMWFNVSLQSKPSMTGAELVLFRKTLHHRPLSVTVTLHSLLTSPQEDEGSPAKESGTLEERTLEERTLEERTLALDQRPSSGYDVFDVSPVLEAASRPTDSDTVVLVGFQLRYRDETGSLELHEALTHSLYCLRRGSLREPLLVLYSHSTGNQT